jgi:thiamine pyrophosphokinase
VEHPPEKDETDLELALLDARRLGVRQTIVLGGVGGRLDMTLANVGLLLHPVARDMSVELWHGLETAYVLSPPGGELPAALGDRISLIPFGGDVHRITTHALAFPLRGESLTVGPARGVSNRVTAARPRVEFASGALLVVQAPVDPEEVQGDDPHDP